MIQTENFTDMGSLLGVLNKSMNLINPEVEDHHEKTAYLSYMLGKTMGIDEVLLGKLVYASLLHDIGSVSTEEQQSVEELEAEAYTISAFGADMLRDMEELSMIADIIEFCQCGYGTIQGALDLGQIKDADTALLSSVIHLADKVAVMLDKPGRILNNLPEVLEIVGQYAGIEFEPQATEALMTLSKSEYVWFDMMYDPWCVFDMAALNGSVSLERTTSLTEVMSKIVDYRSSFTAMHSAGVAASAVAMAMLSGMNSEERLMMKIAGYLHDIGKLVVPKSILEKPGKLTDEEFNIIKEHPYYTRAILSNVKGFDTIAHWAGNHHEKISGKGYPRHLSGADLDLGDKIMSVADIFTAITEIRPYRDGMDKEQAMKVMRENVEYGALDEDLVALLHDNYDVIFGIKEDVSRTRGKRYFDSLHR